MQRDRGWRLPLIYCGALFIRDLDDGTVRRTSYGYRVSTVAHYCCASVAHPNSARLHAAKRPTKRFFMIHPLFFAQLDVELLRMPKMSAGYPNYLIGPAPYFQAGRTRIQRRDLNMGYVSERKSLMRTQSGVSSSPRCSRRSRTEVSIHGTVEDAVLRLHRVRGSCASRGVIETTRACVTAGPGILGTAMSQMTCERNILSIKSPRCPMTASRSCVGVCNRKFGCTELSPVQPNR